ncbi:Uncharacterised protein [Mycobacteroides abscessus subsp. abscessus]|nr:Uncharacterised protein [Mycobacteroides abscessus subsp. abscessus]
MTVWIGANASSTMAGSISLAIPPNVVPWLVALMSTTLATESPVTWAR